MSKDEQARRLAEEILSTPTRYGLPREAAWQAITIWARSLLTTLDREAPLQEAVTAVLRAAQQYGDKAAISEYSDEEESQLLSSSYDYASLLRSPA